MIVKVITVFAFAWVLSRIARAPRRSQCAPLTEGQRLDLYRQRVDAVRGLNTEAQLTREARGARDKANLLARMRCEIPRNRALVVPPNSRPRVRYTGPTRRARRPDVEQTVLPFRALHRRRAA